MSTYVHRAINHLLGLGHTKAELARVLGYNNYQSVYRLASDPEADLPFEKALLLLANYGSSLFTADFYKTTKLSDFDVTPFFQSLFDQEGLMSKDQKAILGYVLHHFSENKRMLEESPEHCFLYNVDGNLKISFCKQEALRESTTGRLLRSYIALDNWIQLKVTFKRMQETMRSFLPELPPSISVDWSALENSRHNLSPSQSAYIRSCLLGSVKPTVLPEQLVFLQIMGLLDSEGNITEKGLIEAAGELIESRLCGYHALPYKEEIFYAVRHGTAKTYKVIDGQSKPAGVLKDQEPLVIYRCIETGEIFHRTQSDFEASMALLEV